MNGKKAILRLALAVAVLALLGEFVLVHQEVFFVWYEGPRGQDNDAVMAAELGHLGCQLRLVPVRLLNRGTQVVDDQHARNAPKMPEGVLQAPDELLCRLVPDCLAVGLAGV